MEDLSSSLRDILDDSSVKEAKAFFKRHEDLLDTLPDEVLIMILSDLPSRSLAKACKSSTRLRSLCEEQSIKNRLMSKGERVEDKVYRDLFIRYALNLAINSDGYISASPLDEETAIGQVETEIRFRLSYTDSSGTSFRIVDPDTLQGYHTQEGLIEIMFQRSIRSIAFIQNENNVRCMAKLGEIRGFVKIRAVGDNYYISVDYLLFKEWAKSMSKDVIEQEIDLIRECA